MYCELLPSFNTLSNTVLFPSVIVTESLVQVTEVAGPPVEIQVRVNWRFSPLRLEFTVNVILPDIVMFPEF